MAINKGFYEVVTMDIKEPKKTLNAFYKELPECCRDFLADNSTRLSNATRIAYAGELSRFFDYMISYTPYFCDKEKTEITVDDLKAITTRDINRFLSHCKDDLHDKQRTIARKRASASSFFSYLTDNRLIEYNPVKAAVKVKIDETDTVIHIDMHDQLKLLNMVDSGDSLTHKQKMYHDRYKLRDYAIILLLLDTGIRVSELRGINIADINFEETYVHIKRKGGKEQDIYFSDEVGDVLQEYIESRRVKDLTLSIMDPLFVSLKGERLTVRAIEKLVKKYTKSALPGIGPSLSPHKMRASFAMQFYKTEKDILALQRKMGHKELAATNVYAKATDETMKNTRSVISEARDQERANQK